MPKTIRTIWGLGNASEGIIWAGSWRVNRNLPILVWLRINKSKLKGEKMLEEWNMSGAAEPQRNGGNVQCRVWWTALLFTNTCCPSHWHQAWPCEPLSAAALGAMFFLSAKTISTVSERGSSVSQGFRAQMHVRQTQPACDRHVVQARCDSWLSTGKRLCTVHFKPSPDGVCSRPGSWSSRHAAGKPHFPSTF